MRSLHITSSVFVTTKFPHALYFCGVLSTRRYKLVAFATKIIFLIGEYILVIHNIDFIVSFTCKLILRISPFILSSFSKFMSQNWLEIYVHVFILQVMKSQLLVIHYKTCTCIYDTRTRRFYKIKCNMSFSRDNREVEI